MSGESDDEELEELDGVGDGSRMTHASGSRRGISSTSSSAGSAGGVNPVG
jgi:hypothetical protein